jgi:hypothetical protein
MHHYWGQRNLTLHNSMGALPVVMDDLGLDPNQVGKATQPTTTILEGDDMTVSDESMISITGPSTPEPSSSTQWTLESSLK